MKILIVDDSEVDRRMLEILIHRLATSHEVFAARNISEMYALLNCGGTGLLLLDISFSKDGQGDSEGLNAIYTIVEHYRPVPFAFVTGHYVAKLKEFHSRSLGVTKQILGYLDKQDYKSVDIESVIEKALAFLADFQKSDGDSKAYLELMEEELEKRSQRMKQELSDSVEKALLYQKAYSGHDWRSRIEAEQAITGRCNDNALHIAIEIEKCINRLYRGPRSEITMFGKLDYLQKTDRLASAIAAQVRKIWNVRNRIAHASGSASLNDATGLLSCCEALQGKLGGSRH